VLDPHTPTRFGQFNLSPSARLTIRLCLGFAALFALFGAMSLNTQGRIGSAEPIHKEAYVALVAIASALCATVVGPISGVFADRGLRRSGSRGHWLVGAALATLAAALVLAPARSVAAVLAGTCVAVAAASAFQAGLAALLPEEVPLHTRARASAAIGVASGVGWAVGTGLSAGDYARGLVVGGLALVLVAALLARGGGGSGLIASKPRGEWLPRPSLRRHRDFWWVFAGRMLMTSSYNIVTVFLLFVVQDYADRPWDMSADSGAAMLFGISAAFALVSAFVSGVLVDRTRWFRLPVAISGCAGAVGLLIPFASPAWGSFLIFAAVQGLAIGVYYTADTALATLVLPDPTAAARDMAILNIASTGPLVLAPVLAAVIVGIAGYRGLFPVAAVGGLLAALSVLRVRTIA
jgi:MFS family permease